MFTRQQMKTAVVLSVVTAMMSLHSGAGAQDLPSIFKPTPTGSLPSGAPGGRPRPHPTPRPAPRPWPTGRPATVPSVPRGNHTNPAAGWKKFFDGISRGHRPRPWNGGHTNNPWKGFKPRRPVDHGYRPKRRPYRPAMPVQPNRTPNYGWTPQPRPTQPARPNFVAKPAPIPSNNIPVNPSLAGAPNTQPAPAPIPTNSMPSNPIAQTDKASEPLPSNTVPSNPRPESSSNPTDRGDTYQFGDDPQDSSNGGEPTEVAGVSRMPESRRAARTSGDGSDTRDEVNSVRLPVTAVGQDEQAEGATGLTEDLESPLTKWGDGNLSEEDQQRLADALDTARGGDTEQLNNLLEDLKAAGRFDGDDAAMEDYFTAAVAAGNLVDAVNNAESLGEIGDQIERVEDLVAGLPEGTVRDDLQDQIDEMETIHGVREQAEELEALLNDALAGIPAASGGGVFDPGLTGGVPVDPGLAGGGLVDPGLVGGGTVDPGLAGGGYVDPGQTGGDYIDPASGAAEYTDPSVAGGNPVEGAAGAAAAGIPVAEATGSTTDSGILVINPPETGSPVAFLIDEQSCELDTDSRQAFKLTGNDRVTITFDRGDGSDAARYTLKAGSYKFKATETGWDLVRTTFKATVENRDLGIDFSYLADGEATTLKDGESITHRGDYPIEMQFDKGDGGQPALKRLESGTFKLGVDEDTNSLNLYEVHEDQLAQN